MLLPIKDAGGRPEPVKVSTLPEALLLSISKLLRPEPVELPQVSIVEVTVAPEPVKLEAVNSPVVV